MTTSLQGPLLGHQPQRSALERLHRGNKLPSAFLFCGPSGIGKRRVARELAQTLFCDTPNAPYGGCHHCPKCTLVAAHNHPDLHEFDASLEGNGATDKLRELLYNLQLTAFYGGHRVIIINNAEDLSAQSTNLLLKSLEEPRPDTHFILTASNRAQILPTVLSRCQSYHFFPLPEKEVRAVLASQFEGSELDELVTLSDGSLSNINELKDDKDFASLARKLLREIHQGRAESITKLCSELTKDKDSLGRRIHFLRIEARQQMLAATDDKIRLRWALLLTNLLDADYYLFSRNISAQGLLFEAFTSFCQSQTSDSFTLSGLDATIQRLSLV